MLYVAIRYDSIRPVVMRVKEELQFSSSTCFALQLSIFRSVLMLYVAVWYVSIRCEGEGRTAVQ